MTTRIKLIAGLTVGLFATLLTTTAAQQPGKISRIGVLVSNPRPAPASSSPYNAFLQELRTLGYVEGQTMTIAWHHTEGNLERRRREAAALVAWKPHVVLAATELEVRALHEVDASIPIVVAGAGDLVAAGLAHSLAQPRGNVTGLQLGECLAPKRLEVLTEVIPRVQRVALLYDRRDDSVMSSPACISADVDAAARRLSIRVQRYAVSTGDDLDRAFPDMKRSAEAVLVVDNPLMFGNRQRIVDLAARHRLPTIHSARSFVEAGAFVSYGRNVSDQYRRAAPFVDRILKGAKPSEMPVQQSMDFELVINMKTAKALRLTIPPSLLSRAERIGE